jgi:L-ascorbate metabolism protein UlaG (beta-lactamase superfamily)
MKPAAQITATGNAGFHLQTSDGAVFIDAFWEPHPRFLKSPRSPKSPDLRADLILVTHSHWDHFDAAQTAEAARRFDAIVAGPADVIAALNDLLPKSQLAALEPPENRPGHPAALTVLPLPGGSVTAFRTTHGRRHNSYLVQLGKFRFFHDGDNEDTRPLATSALAPLDALLSCPWRGSDWVAFVERIAPQHWILIHLDDDEITAHRAGRFLPDLPDFSARVPLPDRTVALRPGEALALV